VHLSILNHIHTGRGFKEVFAKWERLTSGFFGLPHIEAMLDVLPDTNVSRLVHESISDIGSKLTYDFSVFFELLRSETPAMKLPTRFGPAGVFTRFQIVLQQNGITYYPELHTGVFQCLRSVGNTLLFVRLLETAMTKRDDMAFAQNAFFFNTVKPGDKVDSATVEKEYKEGKQSPFGLRFDDSQKGANVEALLAESLKQGRVHACVYSTTLKHCHTYAYRNVYVLMLIHIHTHSLTHSYTQSASCCRRRKTTS
jgi:hypothetical protein